MKPWPMYPVIYEINTWVWLGELGQKTQKPVTLATVPPEEWDQIASGGFDAVWFMGVWERSPAGIEISMRNQGLIEDFKRALPDFTVEDNAGSPYCVRRYVVDEHLGGSKGLAAARQSSLAAACGSSSTLCPTMSPRTTPGSASTLTTSCWGTPTMRATIRRLLSRQVERCLPVAGIPTSRRGPMCSNSTPFS